MEMSWYQVEPLGRCICTICLTVRHVYKGPDDTRDGRATAVQVTENALLHRVETQQPYLLRRPHCLSQHLAPIELVDLGIAICCGLPRRGALQE